jgi:hypothetical protein
MQLYTDLKKDYNLLKYRLGRIPMMMDFIEHGARDPFLYVDYAKSYYSFMLRVERLDNKELSDFKKLFWSCFQKILTTPKG